MPEAQVNEFALNLPVVSAEPAVDFAVNPEYADQAAMVMSKGPEPESAITIGSPEPESAQTDPTKITVYANSINPVSYGGDGTSIAAFDVVFSIGVACLDGSCKTYQVVKRIGVDKCKIACEAELSTPVSIVEAKIEETTKPKINESVSRARRLAGLE